MKKICSLLFLRQRHQVRRARIHDNLQLLKRVGFFRLETPVSDFHKKLATSFKPPLTWGPTWKGLP